MKMYNIHRILNSVFVVLLMANLIACTDDDWATYSGIDGGKSVPVKMVFSAPEADSEVSSRAAFEEGVVSDLYLFVFDENGVLRFKKYYTGSELARTPNSQSGTENYVVEKLPLGKTYIYAFANIDNAVYAGIKAKLNTSYEVGDNCLSDLQNYKLEIDKGHRDLQRGESYTLLSGMCANNSDGTYTIKEGEDIKTVKLRRVDSQITFDFKIGGKCSSFQATKWYIENAPAKAYFIERPQVPGTEKNCIWDASVGNGDFFSTYQTNENELASVVNNTFTFYMPENRKNGETEQITSYVDRERQIKNADGTNGAFQYAPQYGTYIVVHGVYEGTAKTPDLDNFTGMGDKNVYAYVTYKIHLGYVNGRSEAEKSKDFFSRRNTKYTYHVTVRGVDDIVVEVETKDDGNTENSSGATGEIIYTEGTNIYNLDAHYEQILLTFNKSELQKKKTSDFSCLVKTPFTNGIINNVDTDWVKVLKHENASNKNLQAYPLEGKGLISVQAMLDDLYAYSLGDKKDRNGFFDENGNVTYTCFVDEFVYESKPKGSPVEIKSDVPLWKYFVNQPNRKMYIVCHTDLSKDGESSVVSAEYVLSQRAIQTFYNYTDLSLTGLKSAYGIETINETGWLEWGTPASTKDDLDNGWENTKAMLPSGADWKMLVNASDNGYKTVEMNEKVNFTVDDAKMIALPNHYNESSYYLNGMNDEYKKAYIACMQRNRDNNGDGIITDDEIRWYLPSINQYKAMYIGEAGLSTDSRLYFYPNNFFINIDGINNPNLKHYASSTVNSNSPVLLWSEEGTSTSTLQGRWNYNSGPDQKSWNSWKKKTIHYRCVRNLGTVSGVYDNYVTTSGSKSGVFIINPHFINKNQNSVRTSVDDELDRHTYQGYQNRLYEGAFEVNMTERPSSNLKKAITVATTMYYYTETKITYTQRKTNKNWVDAGGRTTTSLDKSSETKPQDRTDTGRTYEWNGYRYRDVTEIKISNLEQKEEYPAPATGCETLNTSVTYPRWRAPNLREFTLMGIFGLLQSEDVCRTRVGYEDYRKGWYWNGSSFITMGDNSYNHGNHIRCVRDVK